MSDVLVDMLHDIAELTHHPNHRYHVLIGADPLGSFSNISGLGYQHNTFEYKELGRNHAPVQLPWDSPGQPGELQLKSGMIVRQMLYDWMNEVQVGGDFRRTVLIIHFTRKWLPLRIYFLTGCWPKNWEGTELSSEGPAEMATETLTLVFDQVSQVPYLGLTALADSQLVAGLIGFEEQGVSDETREKYEEWLAASTHERVDGAAYREMLDELEAQEEGQQYIGDTETQLGGNPDERAAGEEAAEDVKGGEIEGGRSRVGSSDDMKRQTEGEDYVAIVGTMEDWVPIEGAPYTAVAASTENLAGERAKYDALAASSDDELLGGGE